MKQKNKIWSFFIAGAMGLCCFCEPIFADFQQVSVYVEGKYLNCDQGAIILNDRTMVPLRAICEALNCEVKWDESTQTAQIQNEVTAVAIQVANPMMSRKDRVNQENTATIHLDVPPQQINDRILVPARAIAEAIYARVDWNEAEQRVDISMQYETISDFSEGLAVVKKNGLYGYINQKREIAIEPQFDSADNFSNGVAKVVKNGQTQFINITGKKAFDLVSDFQDGYAIARKDDKYGFVNQDYKPVISFLYEEVEPFRDGVALAKKDGLYGFLNPNGSVATPFRYQEVEFCDGYTLGKCAGGYCLLDESGAELTKPVYSRIELYDDNDDVLLVRVDGLQGFMSKQGTLLLPPSYEKIEPFDGRYAFVKGPNGWGTIDREYREVIPACYEQFAELSYDRYAAKKDGFWGVVRLDGEELIPFDFDEILEMDHRDYWVIYRGKKTRIDQYGDFYEEEDSPWGSSRDW